MTSAHAINALPSSVPHKIVTIDARTGHTLSIAPDASVRLSNWAMSWQSVIIEHQFLPSTETPLVFMPGHILSIQLRPQPHLSCRVDGRNQSWQFASGDVFFMAAQVPTRYHWQSATEVLNLMLTLDFFLRSASYSVDTAKLELITHAGGSDPQAEFIGRALHAELNDGSPGGRLLADSLAAALAAHVLARYNAAPLRQANTALKLSERDLARIQSYVHDHMESDLALETLAKQINLSPYHCARLFKASVGMTLHQYVLHVRLEEAKRLLLVSRLTVDQIAARVGFVDRSHLARQFRKKFGVAPLSTRQNST